MVYTYIEVMRSSWLFVHEIAFIIRGRIINEHLRQTSKSVHHFTLTEIDFMCCIYSIVTCHGGVISELKLLREEKCIQEHQVTVTRQIIKTTYLYKGCNF